MTKPINEMNLKELSAYAVTLDGWDWTLVSGAKDQYGFRLFAGPDSHALTAEQAKEWDWAEYEPGRVMNVSCAASYLEEYKLENGIDLSDNATLGCVLAMTRKKHGKYVTTMHRPQGWNVVEYRRLETIHIVESFDTWGFMPILAGEFGTEAHALIAALAKGDK